jgi:deoxyadenosine/deoxycytidine kinase
MTQREFDTYSSIYHAMTAGVLLPSICVRILVRPETCNERIAKRMTIETGREFETAIDIGYLVDLDREIDFMFNVLRSQGGTVLDVPWDLDRDEEARRAAVGSLAARIKSIEPPDAFLDLHRRTF